MHKGRSDFLLESTCATYEHGIEWLGYAANRTRVVGHRERSYECDSFKRISLSRGGVHCNEMSDKNNWRFVAGAYSIPRIPYLPPGIASVRVKLEASSDIPFAGAYL